MRVILLAGGLGTRISEETNIKPKPMVEIGGMPILMHIMAWYSKFGHNDFSIALGYKGEVIKDYFMNFETLFYNLEIDLSSGIHKKLGKIKELPDWKVRTINTGQNTQTGGRIKKIIEQSDDEVFLCTYGDGLSNVNIDELVNFHNSHGKLATVTAVRPPARFGQIKIDGIKVNSFGEKVQTEEGWINGGYFVLDRRIVNYIEGDEVIFEKEPLEQLAIDSQLMAYQHDGFWHPMDTVREKEILEKLWQSGSAPWTT